MGERSLRSVIFVCLGNICRSPLAEAIAKNEANKLGLDIEIKSAGTGSWHIGESPCEGSQKIAKIKGLDISSYRAKQITKKDLQDFDLIVALDSSNYSDLLKLGAKKEKLKKLGCFGYECEDVPDPYFFDGFEGFYKVYEMIEVCIKNLFKEIFS